MSFIERLNQVDEARFYEILNSTTPNKIQNILQGEYPTEEEFIALLSPVAGEYLEQMAQKSYHLTRNHFGQAIQVFAPLYISNYCNNSCTYCGYRAMSHITRHKLSLEEIESEAKAMAADGLRQVLVLTGSSRKESPVSYIRDAVMVLKKYIPMIGIEIYALDQDEYKTLVDAGVSYLTVYQETYNQIEYAAVHPRGLKRNFQYRLDAIERGTNAGMIGVNIGALLGLSKPRFEIYNLALHGAYLLEHYPGLELAFSLPRLRPTAGGFEQKYAIEDPFYVQMLLALRLFIPRAGLTLSTRESETFRNNLLPLGITKVSAGVKTSVGGYDHDEGSATEQFEINDHRSVSEVSTYLLKNGYQPVYKDWDQAFLAK